MPPIITPPIDQHGWRIPAHITTATTTQVKTSAGGVEQLVVGTPGTSLVVKIYDTATYTATHGALISTITWSGSVPASLLLHLWCYKGIAVVTTGSAFDITLAWQ